MYKALVDFCDGENGRAYPASMGGFEYRVGDIYPKNNYTPTAAHVDYLLSDQNRFKRPVIEAVTGQDEKRERCSHCGKEYASEATLAAHIKKEHPDAAQA